MFCPNCGTKVVDGASFCPNCGTRLAPVVTNAPAAPTAPATMEPAPVAPTWTSEPTPVAPTWAPDPAPVAPTWTSEPTPADGAYGNAYESPLDATRVSSSPAAQPVEMPPYSQDYDYQGYGIPTPEPQKRSVVPIVAGVIALLAVVGVLVGGFMTGWFGLAGKGGFLGESDETIIRREVSALFETIKSPSESDVKRYLSSDELALMEQYGIDIADVMRHVFKYLDYRVDEVIVDGNAATARITVTNVDFAAVASSFEQKAEDPSFYEDVFYRYLNGDEASIVDWFLEVLYELIDENSATKTSEQVELTFTKGENGSWSMDDVDYQQILGNPFSELEEFV